MKTCEIAYRDLAGVIRVHDVDRTGVTDCRVRCQESGAPFVTVHFYAGELDAQAYLEPDLARILHHQLGKLFPGDDVVGMFKGLFGMDLTVANLDELKARLMELEEGSLADTTEMPPVALPANTNPKGATDAERTSERETGRRPG